MKKRYQVFVSSTFTDLQEERREVMQALLELRCMPAGMELFPASNDEQWKLIKRVIDDSDYYLVVVAGRYGSIGPSGLSFTEMEYRYALESGKPVIGFVHEAPGTLPASMCESTPEGQKKLEEFRKLVGQKIIKHWKNAHDLGSKVSRSIVNLMEDYPANGWVRANETSEESITEILQLRKRIDELETQLASARTDAPRGTDKFSQGDEYFSAKYNFDATKKGEFMSATWSGTFNTTWNQLFNCIGPLMLAEANDEQMIAAFNQFCAAQNYERLKTNTPELKDAQSLGNFRIDRDSFQTIKVQFLALKLIAKVNARRNAKPSPATWTLTPYGETVLTKLRAIPARVQTIQTASPREKTSGKARSDRSRAGTSAGTAK